MTVGCKWHYQWRSSNQFAHCCLCRLVEDEEDGASSIPDDVTEKLGFIPSIILCAYSIPHHETRDHVLQARAHPGYADGSMKCRLC